MFAIFECLGNHPNLGKSVGRSLFIILVIGLIRSVKECTSNCIVGQVFKLSTTLPSSLEAGDLRSFSVCNHLLGANLFVFVLRKTVRSLLIPAASRVQPFDAEASSRCRHTQHHRSNKLLGEHSCCCT